MRPGREHAGLAGHFITQVIFSTICFLRHASVSRSRLLTIFSAGIPDATCPEDGISIVIASSGLLSQWQQELRDFVEPGNIDILWYEGRLSTRKSWWTNTFGRSLQTVQARKVVLVNYSVSP